MSTKRPRVLVVDDDISTLEIMKLYLSPIADVATALGGQRAIEYVQQHSVDMIFLDVNMPVMDGFKTLEQFRNQKECINVPVVFVTGQRDRDTVRNSVLMGGDGFIAKPIKKDIIQKKVIELYNKQTSSSSRKTILAIDDDMAYLKLIDSYLRDTYNVVIINSTKLALSYLMKHTPDLLLLDYQMPLYNGSSFMGMVNRKSGTKTIPVIILSGALDKDSLKECYACNPDAILAKPISKESLLENIERVLHP